MSYYSAPPASQDIKCSTGSTRARDSGCSFYAPDAYCICAYKDPGSSSLTFGLPCCYYAISALFLSPNVFKKSHHCNRGKNVKQNKHLLVQAYSQCLGVYLSNRYSDTVPISLSSIVKLASLLPSGREIDDNIHFSWSRSGKTNFFYLHYSGS